jgi:hypothetical protein
MRMASSVASKSDLAMRKSSSSVVVSVGAGLCPLS